MDVIILEFSLEAEQEQWKRNFEERKREPSLCGAAFLKGKSEAFQRIKISPKVRLRRTSCSLN